MREQAASDRPVASAIALSEKPSSFGAISRSITRRAYGVGTIAKAISQAAALHAQEHLQDASRTVDDVVANQCLMATTGIRRGILP
jgi:hypothetical protein